MDAYFVAPGHQTPNARKHRFLHPHFQAAGTERYDGTGLAFAKYLVDHLDFARLEPRQADHAGCAAISGLLQQRQNLLQRVACLIQPSHRFRLGQHRWAVGVHVLGQRQVVERLVLDVGTRAQRNKRNRKFFHSGSL